jgi:hypothetical protein
MIIGDFNVVGVAAFPAEADAPLLIDSYAELAGSIARQRFEPVRWRNAQIFGTARLTEHRELVQGALLNVHGQAFRSPLIPDFFGFRVRKALDHFGNIGIFTRGVNTFALQNNTAGRKRIHRAG